MAQEQILQVDNLTKIYGVGSRSVVDTLSNLVPGGTARGRRVVDDVSFHVNRGEIFGFLGPNGSGKTTTIRMSLGIIRPDGGSVSILGGEPVRARLQQVGYLPQETGLPRKGKMLDAIRYLARLKGLSFGEAERRAGELLERTGLYEHRYDKVDALSGGMRQMVQFIVATIHDPDFLILDEPFAGLDPLSTQLMKQMLNERVEAGATIMFSTHIMSDVEEMCERVALIDRGRLLLFGGLDEIKSSYGATSLQVDAAGIPDELGGLAAGNGSDGTIEFPLDGEYSAERVLKAYADSGIAVDRFEKLLPSLNEIFIEEVTRARKSG